MGVKSRSATRKVYKGKNKNNKRSVRKPIKRTYRKKSKGRKPRKGKGARKMRKTRRKQKGGIALNNVPYTPSYGSPGMRLPSNLSALANPVPIKSTNNCGKVSRN